MNSHEEKKQDVYKRSLKYAMCAGSGEEGEGIAYPRWRGRTDKLETLRRLGGTGQNACLHLG